MIRFTTSLLAGIVGIVLCAPPVLADDAAARQQMRATCAEASSHQDDGELKNGCIQWALALGYTYDAAVKMSVTPAPAPPPETRADIIHKILTSPLVAAARNKAQRACAQEGEVRCNTAKSELNDELFRATNRLVDKGRTPSEQIAARLQYELQDGGTWYLSDPED